jgi:hypothetical protein
MKFISMFPARCFRRRDTDKGDLGEGELRIKWMMLNMVAG